MKINNLTFILLLVVILSGLTIAGYVSVHDEAGAPGSGSQNQTQTSEIYASASIPKGTMLLLLAVGVIGALGVSRTKRGIISPAQGSTSNRASGYENPDKDRQKLITKNS